MISLEHCFDGDKIAETFNRATRIVGPQVPFLAYAEILIIGQYQEDLDLVKKALEPKLTGGYYLRTYTALELDNASKHTSYSTRSGVLLLDYVRIGTLSILSLETSLIHTKRCCVDEGWNIVEDDLMLNMMGERFYKR